VGVALQRRHATSSLRCPNGTSIQTQVGKTFDAQATWIVGFAFRASAIPSTKRSLVEWLNGGSNQLDVGPNSDGTLCARRNASTVLGATTNTLSADHVQSSCRYALGSYNNANKDPGVLRLHSRRT
jgi:hypothetical protein